MKMQFVEEFDSLYTPEEHQNENLSARRHTTCLPNPQLYRADREITGLRACFYINESHSDDDKDKAELLHSNSCLRTLNTDLQKAVEMAEDSNMLLRSENNELKNQIRSLKQSIQKVQPLVNELEDIRAAKTEKDQICDAVEARLKRLAKENETLRQQAEVRTSEMSSFILERDQKEEEFTKLSCVLRALQKQLEENRLHLEQKDELINQRDLVIKQLKNSVSEYITINQDMKENLKGLEDQLALALVSSEGSFMNVDMRLALAPENSVSLREELGILSEDQMNPEEEQKEEEDNAETLYVPKSVTHRYKRNIGTGACAAVALCFGVLGVFGVFTPILLTDILDTIRHLIQPYARLYHSGLPPV